jgi:hypothetical protein
MPVRERKEVQEMLRHRVRFPVYLLAAVLAPAAAVPARADMLPDQVATFQKASAKPLAVSNQALWKEYGLEAAEQAEYAAAGKQFSLTAYRLNDSTGAFAAFQWQRPADARESRIAATAAETGDSALVAYGNYLLRFDGWKPQTEDIAQITDRLPKLEKSPLPTLPGYLPSSHLVANSERYVLGPVALAQFDPGIPPSIAAFHMGAEAQLATYRVGAGTMTLGIFSYPTPQIARDQVAAFQKLPGAMAKRTGPLVAVFLSPPDADEAERLLSAVKYEAAITLNERVPTRRDNIGDLIINIFLLIGILLIFCAAAGLAYGGLRALSRRWAGGGTGEEAMIVLHLEDH